MATFTERFIELYDEKQEDAKKKKQCFGFNWLGDYLGSDSRLKSTTLKAYYDGTSTNPSLENLKALATFFGVSVSYLIGESDIRQLGYQADYEVFKKYGFDADTMESLILISQQDQLDTIKYQKALQFLLTDFSGNGQFPALYCIGEYLTRIYSTGKNIVNLGSLADLRDQLEQPHPDYRMIATTALEVIESAEPYSTNELDMFLLSQITKSLERIRAFLDMEQKKFIDSLKGKSETYVERRFNTYIQEQADQ